MPSLPAQYMAAILLYICAYIYALKFAVSIQDNNSPWAQKIRNMHESCLIGCPNSALTSCRGSNYYINSKDKKRNEDLKKCFATFWSGTHFSLYAFLGYFCPDLFWQTFSLGVLFEGYEYKKYDCADPLDILFNTTGFLTGRVIRNSIETKE